jgi:ribonuclease HII
MKWVIGIDEVGRGALAGPVTVAAAAFATDGKGRALHAPFRSLKDSKKLSPSQRERWARELRRHPQVQFVVARIYPRKIERLNISGAANHAALQAFSRLSCDRRFSARTPIYLDGGLFLGSKAIQKGSYKKAKTVIKGDETVPAVAAASIIAKVSRDGFMARLDKKHPGYGFAIHKGYGTAAHRRAIAAAGPCAAHRLTFLKKSGTMNG